MKNSSVGVLVLGPFVRSYKKTKPNRSRIEHFSVGLSTGFSTKAVNIIQQVRLVRCEYVPVGWYTIMRRCDRMVSCVSRAQGCEPTINRKTARSVFLLPKKSVWSIFRGFHPYMYLISVVVENRGNTKRPKNNDWFPFFWQPKTDQEKPVFRSGKPDKNRPKRKTFGFWYTTLATLLKRPK